MHKSLHGCGKVCKSYSLIILYYPVHFNGTVLNEQLGCAKWNMCANVIGAVQKEPFKDPLNADVI